MRYIFLLFCFTVLLFSCANRGSLIGGDKDETPPEIVSLSPENGSTNFTETKINFEFDENIKLNDINNNLLISPPLETKPKIKSRAKGFELIIQDTLLENTTYTFNFGDAIQDLNEGNPISGYTYVFSTGDEIDSLSFSGTATDAFTAKVPENAWVILHKNLEDSAIIKERPYYLAKVDQESGAFQFDYLGEGDYKVYGLIDNNFNYKYDLPDEGFAYTDSTLSILPGGNSPSSIDLAFYVEPSKRTFVEEFKNDSEGRFLLSLRGSRDSLNYQFDSLSVDEVITWNKSKDSIAFWVPKDFASEQLKIITQIADNEKDTSGAAYKNTPILDTTIKINPPTFKRFEFKGPTKFKTKVPATLTDDVEISLLEDSLYVAGGLVLEKDPNNPTAFIADNEWQFGKTYDIIILPGTLTDIYGRTNDSLEYSFQVIKKEELSTLNVALVGREEKQYLIQLMDQEKVVYEQIITPEDPDTYIWKQIVPKGYKLRVIVDENSNGVWDAGSFVQRIQPEKVIRFPDALSLRPDWETDLEIDLSY